MSPAAPAPRARSRRARALSLLAICSTVAWVLLYGAEQWAVGALLGAPNQGLDPGPGDPPEGATLLRVERHDATIEAFVFDPESPGSTVVLLHGIRDQKASYLDTARVFLARGHRVVLVDLRGHGHSGGDYLTYGLEDADDVALLLDTLEETVDLGRVGVVGPSYGGAVALRFGAQDPRVDAVAAVATFSSLRAILADYTARLVPFAPSPPEWFIDWAFDDARERSGVDLNLVNSVDAVRAIRAPILFVHGEDDANIRIENAERLLAACWPGRCRLERRAGRDHGSVLGDEATWDMVLDFLDETLRGAT